MLKVGKRHLRLAPSGNAGSNTDADHIETTRLAVRRLPAWSR
jgi:hypothetical protein